MSLLPPVRALREFGWQALMVPTLAQLRRKDGAPKFAVVRTGSGFFALLRMTSIRRERGAGDRPDFQRVLKNSSLGERSGNASFRG